MSEICFTEHEEPLEIQPCPICGRTDALCIGSRERYESLYKENGGAALVIDCKRCDLKLSTYDHLEKDPGYYAMRAALIAKWNTRKENEYEHKEDK
jgi:hypothetical protein